MQRIVFLYLCLFMMAGTCGSPSSLEKLPWNKERASEDLKTFSREPHPMGSARKVALAEHMDLAMRREGFTVGRDMWTEQVPDPEFLSKDASPMQSTTMSIPMDNVYAKAKVGGNAADCVYIVASHYDSKRLENADGIGANDSGSSSVAILEMMRGIKALNLNLRCHVLAVWFDGEESMLPDWRDGQTRHPARIVDNTYGSRNLADKLKPCRGGQCLPESWGGEKVEAFILLDMVGMPDLRLTPESNSTPALLDLAKSLDKELFEGKLYGRSSAKPVEDDHIAFLEKGVPSLDLIGFEDLSTWHQPTDTYSSVSIESMKQSAELTLAILQRLSSSK